MKYFILQLAVFAMVGVSARGESPANRPDEAKVVVPNDVGSSSPVQTAAQEFIVLLQEEKFDEAVKRFDGTMTKALPVENVRAIWQAVIQQNGAFQHAQQSKTMRSGGYDVVDMPCELEKATLVVRVALDKEKKVAGLFFLPVPVKKGPSDVEVVTPSGTLVGTFDLPSGKKGPWPVVVFIVGSGPVDRDGNSGALKNECLKQLGQSLAKRGIAVLRYDKRGVAASAAAGPDESKLSIAKYADDTVAWVRKLRADKRFTKVAVLGHSEGSLVGILAAKQVPCDALISIAGSGRPIGAVLREQLKPKLPAELNSKANEIVAELEAGRTVADVPEPLMVLFRPSVQPYFMSWLKYDPAKEIAGMSVPILVVQGTTDLQVTVEDAKLLACGNRRATLTIIEDMNHVMKHTAETTLAGQARCYSDPAVPIEPRLVEAVGGFLKEKVGAGAEVSASK
jgi:pimeloyl-ACP methyl ester carboxylesterase